MSLICDKADSCEDKCGHARPHVRIPECSDPLCVGTPTAQCVEFRKEKKVKAEVVPSILVHDVVRKLDLSDEQAPVAQAAEPAAEPINLPAPVSKPLHIAIAKKGKVVMVLGRLERFWLDEFLRIAEQLYIQVASRRELRQMLGTQVLGPRKIGDAAWDKELERLGKRATKLRSKLWNFRRDVGDI